MILKAILTSSVWTKSRKEYKICISIVDCCEITECSPTSIKHYCGFKKGMKLIIEMIPLEFTRLLEASAITE